MKRKKFLQTLAGVVAAVVMATSIAPTGLAKANENSSLETSDVSALGDGTVAAADSSAAEDKLATPQRVSVHDPSIVKDNNTYYVFGSHLANAKSTDLINWTQMTGDYGSYDWQTKSIYGKILENLSESFEWAGYNDGDCANGGLAVWAPDVIWNEDYVWEDGSTGAWMIYYSASSTWRRSCIGYAVSKDIEGTYEYVDTVIYSGFTREAGTDGNSTRDTKWDNKYLNLKELTEKYNEEDPSHGNGIEGISDKWFDSKGGWNNNYAPNAIDPTLFYGADDKLYMVYGSWSGGLFILEIDKKTGAVIYPGKDSVDKTSGNFTDRYFGTHIAGANHQSGEGPFIDYDKATGYYWLYETYGGLTSTGGYNMRLFRSKNVYGPYVDAAGNNAANSGVDNDKYGVKLIGNYQFLNQPGYRAAGHNSALIDDNRSRYLVFHQRFDEPENQTERHEVRVHQQFLNEEKWPVTAVYENRGEQIAHYEDAQVVGSYEIINHGTDSTGNMIQSQIITLNADGTITGELTGRWKKTTEAGKDYDYVTLEIGTATYKGVFFEQQDETAAKNKVMTFTAIGNNNESLWGSALPLTDEVKTQLAAAVLDAQMPSDANADITLATELKGATISWASDKADVVANDGKVTRPDEDTEVTLTATIQSNDATLTREYKVKIASKAKLICGYDFEAASVSGDAISAVEGSLNASPAALKGTAKIVNDPVRGQVLQIVSPEEVYNLNYLALPEDTLANVKTKGYTVAMWVNCGADIFEHSALFNAMLNGTYPMTRIGVNLCGRINANGYIDGGYYNTVLRGTGWHHVAYSIDATGLKTWVDGKLFEQIDKDLTSCFDATNAASIHKATDVRVGSGSPWVDRDIENAMFDDVKIYDTALIQSEVQALYESTIKNPPTINPPTINPPTSYPSGGSPSTDSPSTEKPAKDDKEPVKEETKTEVGTEVKVEEGKFEVIESKTDEPAVAFTAPASTKEKKVEIPDVVTVDGKEYKVTKIADGAYKKNSKITTVTIGENVTVIGKNAFSGCTNLKTVKINANVEKIGNGAFNGCKKMEKVSIPKNVQEIGAKAFNGCKNLKTITIKSTALKKVDATAFKGIKANATIKVPKKQYKAYKKMLKKVLPSTVRIVKY